MKVLFVGGTGIISSGVTPLVVERGMELVLLNRGHGTELVPRGARQVTADIRDPGAVKAALRDESFDVVVDWLVFTPQQLEASMDLFRDRTSQYIFISSASAYQKPSTSLSHHRVHARGQSLLPVQRDKIACEDRLVREYREKGLPMTIVRPSFTYGLTMIPAGYQSWLHPWTTVDRMRRKKKIIVHGDGTSLWTMTHNTDFARGFVGLFGNPHAIGHTVHITSDEVLTWDQIVTAIGRAAGVQPDIVHVASDFISAFDPEARGPSRGRQGELRGIRQFEDQEPRPGVPRHGAVRGRSAQVGGVVREAPRTLHG